MTGFFNSPKSLSSIGEYWRVIGELKPLILQKQGSLQYSSPKIAKIGEFAMNGDDRKSMACEVMP